MLKYLEKIDFRVLWAHHHKLRCRLLDRIMPVYTHLGSAGATIVITLVTMLAGYATNNSLVLNSGEAMAKALFPSHLFVHYIKRRVNRPRPQVVLEGFSSFNVPICPYSFPSGHTNASFAVAVAMFCFQPMLGLPMLVLAAGIGFSRMYLGLHFMSDVVAGGLIGSTFGIISGMLLPSMLFV